MQAVFRLATLRAEILVHGVLGEDLAHRPGDVEAARDEIVARLLWEIEAAGSPPVCLATVLVGDDKPSRIYVSWKHKKAQEAGMISKGLELPSTASQAQVEDAVSAFAADPRGAQNSVSQATRF